MHSLKAAIRFALFSILFLTSSFAAAQDNVETRGAAVDRYFRAAPVEKVLDDAFLELSKQIPQDQRAQFLSQIRTVVRADTLERIARESMIETFTADELNALADFYGSKNGSSAMLKFGSYLAQVMPAVQAEVARSLEQLKARGEK